ncbi:hypothetical protein TNIN_125901 [Trichonephila inaurata madagascariensis]|uniref:Uncharacterized protein n=1 Tax=Trichonephila inaurata madagascariensis TaxID=2747483 RepID=A0A8X6Y179_9ARAC|nr:hypothetical protein TNIN_125901 [Trichonephila inaurata madagascariensis]
MNDIEVFHKNVFKWIDLKPPENLLNLYQENVRGRREEPVSHSYRAVAEPCQWRRTCSHSHRQAHHAGQGVESQWTFLHPYDVRCQLSIRGQG